MILVLFVNFLNFDVGFEQRPDGDAVGHMDDELKKNAGGHANQQVGRQNHHQRCHEDRELLFADSVDMQELSRMRQTIAGVDQHRSECGKRNPVQDRGDQSNAGQQEDAVPHVCESGSCSVVDVGSRTDNLGNHRQTTNESGGQVSDADRDDVAIHVRLPLPRIEQVNRLGAEQ